MDTKQHWEKVYFDKSANAVSWFQPHAIRSLKLIQRLVVDKAAHIIDVGGGASTLVDDLLEQGYSNLSVLDLSAAALQVANQQYGRSYFFKIIRTAHCSDNCNTGKDLISKIRLLEGGTAMRMAPRE